MSNKKSSPQFDLLKCYGCYRYRNAFHILPPVDGLPKPNDTFFVEDKGRAFTNPGLEELEDRARKFREQAKKAASDKTGVALGDLLLELWSFWPYFPILWGFERNPKLRKKALKELNTIIDLAPILVEDSTYFEDDRLEKFWDSLRDLLSIDIDTLRKRLSSLPAVEADAVARFAMDGSGRLSESRIQRWANVSVTVALRFLRPDVFAIISEPSLKAAKVYLQQHHYTGDNNQPPDEFTLKDQDLLQKLENISMGSLNWNSYKHYLEGLDRIKERSFQKLIPTFPREQKPTRAQVDMAAWAFTYSCLTFKEYKQSYSYQGHKYITLNGSSIQNTCENWDAFTKAGRSNSINLMRWPLSETWHRLNVRPQQLNNADDEENRRAWKEEQLTTIVDSLIPQKSQPIRNIVICDSYLGKASGGGTQVNPRQTDSEKIQLRVLDVALLIKAFIKRCNSREESFPTITLVVGDKELDPNLKKKLLTMLNARGIVTPKEHDWLTVDSRNDLLHDRLFWLEFKDGSRLWLQFDKGHDLFKFDNKEKSLHLVDTFIAWQSMAF